MDYKKFVKPFIPKKAWYRHRTRPGKKGKYRIIIQKRVLLFWKYCLPIENYTSRLEHEALWMFERLRTIIDQEHPEAERYVDASYEQVELNNLQSGTGQPFRDIWLDREDAIPDVSTQYKELVKLFRKIQDPKVEGAGTTTAYLLPEHTVFHNREQLGARYDSVMDYRYPREQNQSRKKGGGQPRNQHNQ